jgi:hypothetical protein
LKELEKKLKLRNVAIPITSIAIISLILVQNVGPNIQAELNFDLVSDIIQADVAEEITFSIINIAGEASKFTWLFHDSPDVIETSSDNTSISHSFSTEGLYKVSVVVTSFNSYGYQIDKLKTVDFTIRNTAPVIMSKTSELTGYEDKELNFSISEDDIIDSLSDLESMKYTWYLGDGAIKNGSSISHTFKDAGLYDVIVVVEDDQGQKDQRSINVSITNISPFATFSSNITDYTSYDGKFYPNTVEDQVITFNAENTTDTESDISTLDFLWNLGDGTFDSGPIVDHKYANEGKYTVKLSVKDHGGLSSEYVQELVISNVRPTINQIELRTFEFNEGETITVNSMLNDTESDIPRTTYKWFLENQQKLGKSTSWTLFDEKNIELQLHVEDDNHLASYLNQPVVVKNVAPKASIINANLNFDMNLKITGEKWHDVNVYLLNEQNNSLFSYTLIRYPENPNSYALNVNNIKLDLRHSWRFELYYTPYNDTINGQPNGANPVNLTLNMTNPSNEYFISYNHTFNYNQPEWNNWTVPLDVFTYGFPVEWEINYFDPGNDNLTLTISENDNSTTFIQTAPVGPNQGTTTIYSSAFANITWPVTLKVEDEDGASTITYYWLNSTSQNNSEFKFTILAPKITELKTNVDFDDSAVNYLQYIAYEHDFIEFSIKANQTKEDFNLNEGLIYRWSFGDGVVQYTKQESIVYNYNEKGVYLVNVEVQGKNYTSTRGLLINIANKIPEAIPIAHSFSDQRLLIGEKIVFEATNVTDSENDLNELMYYWDFGDGDVYSGSSRISSHIYFASGEYNVTLFVEDTNGAKSNNSMRIIIENSPPAIDVIELSMGEEGNNIGLDVVVNEITFEKSTMDYKWTIGSYTSTNKRISKYFDDGEYTGTILVTDQEGLSSLRSFSVKVLNKVPEMNISNQVIYGALPYNYSLAVTYFDVHSDQGKVEYSLNGVNWIPIEAMNGYIDVHVENLLDGLNKIPFYIKNSNTNEKQQLFIPIKITADSDGDGLTNYIEGLIGTDISNPDTDYDHISDAIENAGDLTNPLYNDTDNDGLFDGINPDTGLGEFTYNTDPSKSDTDNDGLTDGSEVNTRNITIFKVVYDALNRPSIIQELIFISSDPLDNDTDQDGLSDSEEYYLGSNPRSQDTDNDGLQDAFERKLGTALAHGDTDQDELIDSVEVNGYSITFIDLQDQTKERIVYSDPFRNDTDNDRILDKDEFLLQTDTSNKDTDQDYLLDIDELNMGTELKNPDTDNDGLIDGVEVKGWNITVYDLSGAKYSETGDLLTTVSPLSSTLFVHSDPKDPDTDNDELSDYTELNPTDPNKISNPRVADSDGDGILDRNDDIPLVSDYKAPTITGTGVNIHYDINVLQDVYEKLIPISKDLSLLLSLVNDNTVFNLVKNILTNPTKLATTLEDYVRGLGKSYFADQYTNQTWTDRYITLTNFVPTLDKNFEDVTKFITKAVSTIAYLINWNDLFNLIVNIITNPASLFDTVKNYILGLAEKWVKDFISNWNTVQLVNFKFVLELEYAWIFPIGIKKFAIYGDIKIGIVESVLKTVGLTFTGTFSSLIKVLAEGATQLLNPNLRVEFSAEDTAGIDDIRLWVNRDHTTTAPTVIREYGGSKTANFQWSRSLNELMESTDKTADISLTIELHDINGNIRLIQKTQAGFTISLVNETITKLQNILADTWNYVVGGIIRLGEQAQQAYNNFVEDVIEVGGVLTQTAQSALKFVWEGIISNVINSVKNIFFEPSEKVASQIISYESSHRQEFITQSIQILNQSSITNSLNSIDDKLNEFKAASEPIIGLARSFSSFTNDLLSKLLAIFPEEITSLINEAINLLGDLAIQILFDGISTIILGLVSSLINQLSQSIFPSFMGNFLSNFDLGSELANLGSHIDDFDLGLIEPAESTSLENPLSIFTVGLDLLTGLPNLSEIHVKLINFIDYFFKSSPIFNKLLQGNINDMSSGKGIMFFLLTPIVTIVNSVVLFFKFQGGITLDIINTIINLDPNYLISNFAINLDLIFETNQNSGFIKPLNEEINGYDFTFTLMSLLNILIGITSEFHGLIRESWAGEMDNPQKSNNKLFLGLLMLYYSIFNVGTSSIMSELLYKGGHTETHDYIQFFSKKAFNTLLGAVFRVLRDLIDIYKAIHNIKTHPALDLVKRGLYLGTIFTNIYKIIFVTEQISEDASIFSEPAKTVLYIGYIASIVEDLGKIIIYILKIFNAENLLHKFEIQLRKAFILIDFVEDFFLILFYNRIRYDVKFFGL